MFSHRLIRWFVVLTLVGVPAKSAHAGMPSLQLIVTELGRRRLEEVSFFLVGFLLLTAFCRWLWNGLSKDIPALPKLSYRGALSLMVLWGLALTVVLSLISGARELMTQAAWEPNGITHRLAGSQADSSTTSSLSERKLRLQLMKQHLWNYAASHDGHFPDVLALLGELPVIPDAPLGLSYHLTPRLEKSGNRSVLLAEPDIYADRLSLLTDGTIVIEDHDRGATP